jgi:2-dehydro-3-deoxyphosphogluconate aldolase/(4S)-4-hydroxy-2-oxoglutarate aldolase
MIERDRRPRVKAATLQRIRDLGLIAVLRGPSEDATVRAVDALVAGGVRGIEITYSTPNAAAVTRTLAQRFGDAIVLGMGTLTTPIQVAEACAAGARFLVTPILEEALVRAMTASPAAIMVGALTPSEVYRAHALGSDMVKLFPGSLVGPAYVKALRGPFPTIPLVPTGGVSVGNVAEWFAAGVAAVGAGGELCPAQAMVTGRFDAITASARAFVDAVGRARGGSAS